MNSKRRKSPRKPKSDTALATVESQFIAAPSPHPEAVQKTRFSEAAEQAFSKWMKEVSGTEHEELQSKLLSQAVVATPVIGQEFEFYDCAAAALHGIAPKDELEGMLAVQMVAAHTMAMECLRRAALPNQIDLGVEVNINRGTKLMRTFASLTEALSRYRGKGEQRMIVEHVHVHKGGQAIVGPVSQHNSGIRGEGDEKE